MTATPFEKLTAMWQSGEINDDEFKLAAQYLREEQAKLGALSGRAQPADHSSRPSDQSLATQLAWLLLPRATLNALAPWQRYLVEIGVFVAVAGVGLWLISQLFVMLVLTDAGQLSKFNPLGAAGWTIMLLALGGFIIRYNWRAMVVIGLPMFALILSMPLWPEASRANQTATNSDAAASYRPALEKMSIAFQGNYSPAQISGIMDATMRNLGVKSTEAERVHWGDVLVHLRKNTGVQEMEILRCVHAMGDQKITFDFAAATCVAILDN